MKVPLKKCTREGCKGDHYYEPEDNRWNCTQCSRKFDAFGMEIPPVPCPDMAKEHHNPFPGVSFRR